MNQPLTSKHRQHLLFTSNLAQEAFITPRVDFRNADCKLFLPKLPDASVDLVLIDPPYQISDLRKRANGVFKDMRVRQNFGYWDSDHPSNQSLDEAIPELFRVLKPGGRLVCFYDVWKITTLRDMLAKAGFDQFRVIQWHKSSPVPINASRDILHNGIEYAISCTKGSNAFFSRYMHNGIFEYGIVRNDVRIHPTQKPVELLKELIRSFTHPGQTVLDCYAGSASTAVAAFQTGRHFVGCERDWTHFQAAEKRIERCMQSPRDVYV
ncbi:site-specific DNA-methyltransferase [Burkholderia multivorans]|uniref:DNA-methyltransferase n=1 Tax=Burkholderia multivorans TaxID=87883 RepID=UPI001C250D30|nr:site-specific DNA-methyltransferase [Burkholderia multivorans]